MKAVKGEEILLSTENKEGLLAAIATVITEKSINIRAISAYVVGSKAYFHLVTSDNIGTKEVLRNLGTAESKEVIIVEMPDRVGQLAQLVSRLKEAGIDLMRMYGTAAQVNGSAILILSSSNNNKVLDILSNVS
ncbi:MAG: hypothetical protein PHV55_00085 [Candidatus Omnitrophica bacterium]|nr:hypothetical protein [Candidatus Omnitrophota bacterium]